MPISSVFPVYISIFELRYADVRTRLETHISTQSAGALKLSIQVRFHRSLRRRSPQRDARNTGMAMNPHWLQGFARRPRRWRDRPDRAVGTEDKTGPDAGHAPQCRMRGRPWILPPDALVIQSGGPLEASAGHGARTPSRSAEAHGAGSEVRTAAGCRLRSSAAATTQAPGRPRLAGGYKAGLRRVP
jgi:hypothetical protein